MSCLMGSQGLVLATAVAVSAGTVILFDLLRQKYFSIAHLELTNNNVQHNPKEKNPILKSCLSSGEKKMNSRKKKTKKVHFAANLKDSNSKGEEYRREYSNSYEKEILGMPANRRALYTKILKNRIHRMDICY